MTFSSAMKLMCVCFFFCFNCNVNFGAAAAVNFHTNSTTMCEFVKSEEDFYCIAASGFKPERRPGNPAIAARDTLRV